MLKRINETMQVRMTLEEANEYNELVERNKAMPIRVTEDDDGKKFYYCSNCNKCIGIADQIDDFCGRCGQRLDKENIAL